MKRVLTILMALIFTSAAWAQQAESSAFTLQQCIQYALENSVLAKNADMEQQIAKAKVKETVGIGLPQISGSASVVHNQKLQRFFTTYTGAGGFIDLSAVPGIQNGDVVAAQNFFQLKSSGTASVAINQILFNGTYLVGLKASKTYTELSQRQAEQTDQDIVEMVTKNYYAVLINKERTKLYDANVARVDSLLKNTTAQNQNGFAEGIDVDRVKVTLNNLLTERESFINTDILGIQLLKYQMNYPQDKPLEVIGSIADVEKNNELINTEPYDYKNRPDYRVLQVNRRLQELNIRNMQSQSIPSLSAFATLGTMTQSPNVSGLFKTNSKIEDSGGVGPDKWYTYNQFGVSATVPIFSGLQRHYRTQQEKIKLMQIDNLVVNLKNNINLQITQSSLTFENALKALTSQRENQNLAKNVARVTKIKFEQGVGSSLEVTDAENALRNAQTNYYSALYTAMSAKVDLDKANGRLNPATTTTNSK